jgi:hypothetical protein
LHILQARKPAPCASAADLKNRTFAFNGRRLVQFGLQNTPVVVTA